MGTGWFKVNAEITPPAANVDAMFSNQTLDG